MILDLDRQMYHAETDTRFSCRTTNLNEDLGQVSASAEGVVVHVRPCICE